MRRLWLLPLSAALAACPPKIDVNSDGGGLINTDQQGGIYVRLGATIEIPAGAVSGPTVIFVTVMDSGIPDVPGRTRISLGYRFTPSTLAFAKPVTIILPYDPSRLPAPGIDPNSYDMRRNSNLGAYDILTGAQTNPAVVCAVIGSGCTVVQANSDHLGLFWITSPIGPNVAQLTISPSTAFLQVGQTQQFTATATDGNGNTLDNVSANWSIVPARAASVTDGGLVTALAPGNATLTAAITAQTATATVYIQGNTKGPLTFFHDNPYPTGNDLFGGAITGAGTFFVGGNGTVVGLDGAGNFSHLFSFPLVTLQAIAGGASDITATGVGLDNTGNTVGIVVEMKAGATQPSVTTFPTALPRAMWFDGTTGMAVGTGNDVLAYRGGTWTNLCPRGTMTAATCYSPSIETLLSVIGDGMGGFVTIGNRGSIYQFDPTTNTWNSLYPSQLSVRFDGAFIVDPAGAEAWGVGGNKLWHFTNGAWAAINLPASPVLDATTAMGPAGSQIAVAGTSGALGYLLLYTPPPPPPPDAGAPDAGSDSGTAMPTWTAQAMRGPQVIRGIFGSATGGYAVGDFGAIWGYANGAYSEVSRGFYGDVSDIAVVGSTPIATANECASGDGGCLLKQGEVMIRVDAGVWTPLGGFQPFSGPLTAISAASLTNVFVAGGAAVFHFDGSSWSSVPLSGAPPSAAYDMEQCGTQTDLVGSGGAFFSGQATLVQQPASTSSDLHALMCPTPTDVWTAGDFVVFENGQAIDPNQTVNPAPWRSVWSPGPTEGFAFGISYYGVYWDGVTMHVIQAPGGLLPDNLPAMWGSTIDNLYLVGDTVTPVTSGYGVRFDGANWTLIDIGAHRKATAVAGSSATEVWVGTEGGGLTHGQSPP